MGLAAAGALFAFQMPFREYEGQEYNDFPLPADYKDKAEFVFGRLMYPQGDWGIFGWLYRFDGGRGAAPGPTIIRVPIAISCWRSAV